MKKKRLCTVINNHKFIKLPERPGSEKDYKDLIEIFENTLGFQIEKGENLTKDEILSLLRKVQNLDYTEYSALFVIIMTHGDKHAIYASDDQKIDRNELISMFTTAKCPRLTDKPKVFLFQTCQGNTDTASSSHETTAPNIPDFLIGYSGITSMRNVKTGAWYIQEFCQSLKSHCHEEDLVRILTRVNDSVKKMSSDDLVEQPHFHSHLGKLLYLRPICQTTTKQHQMVVQRRLVAPGVMVMTNDKHKSPEKGSDEQNAQAQNNGQQEPLEPTIIVLHGDTSQQQELQVHTNNSQSQEVHSNNSQSQEQASATAEIVVPTPSIPLHGVDSKPPLRGEALNRKFIATYMDIITLF